MSIRGHPYITCDLEPIGGIRIRTSDGLWIDLAFDIDEEWQLTGLCDGCGTAFIDNQQLGQICIDMDGLFNWTDKPW